MIKGEHDICILFYQFNFTSSCLLISIRNNIHQTFTIHNLYEFEIDKPLRYAYRE
ncbi:hypothetical protein HanRHA438_Chr08g0359451 [Helianthus annuus]|uniref:Uncharacterized protein n=1 Tax=Helianthus annuus TaxID=4232 RepID=A0A251UA49_HELAN|nr:hypothetical protein HanXRQr2_Chr08g0347301 [Helianthus annuus]KAJ0547661.1 hypothetical protein HanIR_Chr08g0374661 [Helianthus annuus]KAJ0554194.1 hypothetical protein HanHA89_Chr08g0304921 [Helianthus annuus]KAJ0719797.1 hypothetical protein HanLR1_Chr08g0285751 [Helianthus annuus]KAJ0723023.1 hypothetical protein HanOQP8_Chr08g0293261 [Helianthus annuus]